MGFTVLFAVEELEGVARLGLVEHHPGVWRRGRVFPGVLDREVRALGGGLGMPVGVWYQVSLFDFFGNFEDADEESRCDLFFVFWCA